MDLKSLACQPCRGAEQQVSGNAAQTYMDALPGWQTLPDDGVAKLVKTFEFTNYTQCLAFVQEVGHMAEQEDHHPEITLSWGKVRVAWWTHTIGGLHLNDFILAARCDDLAESFYVNY